MTKTQLNQFKKTLGTMEAAVLHRVDVEKSEIVIEKAPDFTDDVWSTASREVALANLARDSGLLHNVRGALERIRKGTFGVCLNCGEAISQKRLVALPWTRFCIGCQEDMDGNSDNASPEQTSTSLLNGEGGAKLQVVARSNP